MTLVRAPRDASLPFNIDAYLHIERKRYGRKNPTKERYTTWSLEWPTDSVIISRLMDWHGVAQYETIWLVWNDKKNCPTDQNYISSKPIFQPSDTAIRMAHVRRIQGVRFTPTSGRLRIDWRHIQEDRQLSERLAKPLIANVRTIINGPARYSEPHHVADSRQSSWQSLYRNPNRRTHYTPTPSLTREIEGEFSRTFPASR